jgi:hypothetical protein
VDNPRVFLYFSEAMTRRVSFVTPLIIGICLLGGIITPAAAANSAAHSPVQQLANFRGLLAKAASQDGSLATEFRKIAQEYRKAGFPEIGNIIQDFAPRTFAAFGRHETLKFLGNARNLSMKLSLQVMSETSLVGSGQTGHGRVVMPDYLGLAVAFAYELAKAGLNVVDNRPITRGIPEFTKPFLLIVTYNDTTGAPNDTVTTFSGGNTYTGSGSVVGSASFSVNFSSFDQQSLFPTILTSPIQGTMTVSRSVTWSRDMTVDTTATLVVSSSASLNLNTASSTFKLLGTLSLDLAPTFVTPITGMDTSTFDLETGATLNVKNPAPGTYTILSGFQSTGNTLGDVTITGLVDGQTGTLTQANGSVTLTITAASPTPSPTP